MSLFKNISALFLLLVSNFIIAQSLEEDIINSFYKTLNTSNIYSGYWTKIATCQITVAYQDFGTKLELFGNGSSNNTFFYGELGIRIKRQNSVPGLPTNYSLFLFDSNIGSENIKGIVNGTTVDFYVKVNSTYTRYYYRRIIKAGSAVSCLDEQPYLAQLPSGDIIIDCKDGSMSVANLDVSGNVAIGLENPSEKLEVNGTIRSKEVKVEATGWPDYVFKEDYILPSLKETESYIKENQHLPGIPSAEEVEENGISVGEMNVILLKKIEEMTLHLIHLNKVLKLQQKEINQLKSRK